jgi:hypothetical protein
MGMTHVRNLNDPDDEVSLNALADAEWFYSDAADLRFDHFGTLTPEAKAKVVPWVASEIDRVKPPRRRARKEAVQRAFELAIEAITASAITAMEGGRAKAIYFSRGHYHGTWPYARGDVGAKTFLGTVDAMEAAGLVKCTRARRSAPKGWERRQRSTFRPTRRLIDGLKKLGVTGANCGTDWDQAPVVLLRDKNKVELAYEPAIVAAESAELRAYNAFLRAQRIELSIDLPRGCDPRRVTMRRIYNGDFFHGGRFYGGFWQGQAESIRAYITINGERTVELDFASFLARAVYHEEELTYPGDPYDVPELMKALTNAGIPPDQARKVIKRMFFAMLNGKSRKHLKRSKSVLTMIGTTGKNVASIIDPELAFSHIENHNRPIAHRFFTRYSTIMMKKESDICAMILQKALRDVVPVLPIHDSYVVQERHKQWLHDAMISSYKTKFTFSPVVD